MRKQKVALVCLLGTWLTAVEARGAETGRITGTVDKPAQVTAVVVVNRETNQKFPGKLEARSGRFTIDGLRLGAVYDCVIDFSAGRLEGVNLKVPRSDYEEEQPLAREDIEAIKASALSLNKFEDKVEVLTVTGNIQHAAVLLNKLRTRPFYASKPGEVVWRLELWRFERPEETWVKVQDELFTVLYRERIPKSVYDKKSITLDPALGGLRLTDKEPRLDLGLIKLPGKQPGIRMRSEKTAGTKSQ